MAKYYYNGILLPEIPSDILSQYPYCWIRDNSTTGNYDLVVAPDIWYYTSNSMNKSVNGTYPYYSISKESYLDYEEWVYNTDSDLSFGIDTSRFVLWTNHDIPNGSATSTTIYFFKSGPIPENSVKSKELRYTIFTNFYLNPGTITYALSNDTINYVVPVHKGSTYTVTMNEIGNRLRSVFTTVDPSTITSNVSNGITDIVMNPEFSIGYTFSYLAKSDGWMIVYVSNAGEMPEISIETNGVGGDGSPLYDCLYLIRSDGQLYTVMDDVLALISVTEVTSQTFRDYGFEKLPKWQIFSSLNNPEILYWEDYEPATPETMAKIVVSQVAVPLPKWIVSNRIDLTDETIKGIENVTITCDGDVLFAVSFDDKATWKVWTGTTWATVSEEFSGMTKEQFESVTYLDWVTLYEGADSFYIKAMINENGQSITKIYVDFAN